MYVFCPFSVLGIGLTPLQRMICLAESTPSSRICTVTSVGTIASPSYKQGCRHYSGCSSHKQVKQYLESAPLRFHLRCLSCRFSFALTKMPQHSPCYQPDPVSA